MSEQSQDRARSKYDIDPGVEALIRLEAHEDACAERMSEVRRSLGTISNRMWWILGTAIVGACAIAFEIFKNAT